jgi:hypothetical protein
MLMGSGLFRARSFHRTYNIKKVNTSRMMSTEIACNIRMAVKVYCCHTGVQPGGHNACRTGNRMIIAASKLVNTATARTPMACMLFVFSLYKHTHSDHSFVIYIFIIHTSRTIQGIKGVFISCDIVVVCFLSS